MALYIAADGKSDLSGEPLDDSFHADHKIAFSAGGETDVANGQALTPKENLMKSNKRDRFAWQTEFLRCWETSGRDFLLCAVPGAGKTKASLQAASLFRQENPGCRIIVVVPSLNLRSQWREVAGHDFKIALQSKEFTGTLKPKMDGAVVTYQAIGQQPYLFRRLVSMQKTLVILDEVHHAGEQQNWGESIKHAFENCTRRLCLSGTPFRTDGALIPFINYGDDAFCLSEPPFGFRYDYPNAVTDRVLRTISFHHHFGKVEYIVGEDRVVGEINENIDEEEAKRHLSKLLSADNEYCRSLLERANERLIEVRSSYPRAGGLVLCIDSSHAERIAKQLKRISGHDPDVVLSDDAKATSNVDKFRKSDRHWIVAVRQVSEGVDIKRLMVQCYLTNTATELFFRQAVGRIVRNQSETENEEGYCYLPEDPRLVRMAKRIMHWQIEARRQQDQEEKKEREQSERERNEFAIISTSEATPGSVVIEGNAYRGDDAELIQEVAALGKIPEAAAARLNAQFDIRPKFAREETKSESDFVHPEDACDPLRKAANKLVGRLKHMTGKSFKEIHTEYMKVVCPTPQDIMSEEQLNRKIQWLQRRIEASK